MSNLVDKVIKVAKEEVGYLEKKTNSQLDSKTANAGYNNYTKYWRDLNACGYQGQPWCNAWVNWCFVKAYGEKEAKKLLCTPSGWSYYTPTSAGYFKAKCQWYTSNPKAGDVIYFKDSKGICHVGLVYKVDSKMVYTYEGNTSAGSGVIANGGGVAAKSYALSNTRIAGYGRPKYDVATTTTTKKKAYSGTFPTLPSRGYFKKGDKGTQVKNLQKFLLWWDPKCLPKYGADSDYGDEVIAAVKKFEKEQKITQDGLFGKSCLEKAKAVKK